MNNEEIARFFRETPVQIYSNPSLREPQVGAYQAIHDHFSATSESCYVQLPVGSGKTGLMGLRCFATH